MKSYIQPRIHITTIQHDMNFLAASMEQMVNRMVKTEDIHPPKTGISVHFGVLSLMAMQN